MRRSKLKEVRARTTDTLIGAGTVIEGKLHSEASIRVDGTVRGNIHCKGDLYVGAKAVLHSDVEAANIHHAGKIHGTVTTGGTLFITQSGKIYGDLDVARIQIAEGAVFEGTIIMKTPDEGKAPATPIQKPERERVKAVK